MLTFFFAYTTTAYLFSGSLCYLAAKADQSKCSEEPLSPSLDRFNSLQVTLLWPLWIIEQARKEP